MPYKENQQLQVKNPYMGVISLWTNRRSQTFQSSVGRRRLFSFLLVPEELPLIRLLRSLAAVFLLLLSLLLELCGMVQQLPQSHSLVPLVISGSGRLSAINQYIEEAG
uniref:Uncharacterized protein n=1 Tax=Musa acuminata subsp. malaccensis TaxID=214687 RepID=A0A804HMG3_MUSAM